MPSAGTIPPVLSAVVQESAHPARSREQTCDAKGQKDSDGEYCQDVQRGESPMKDFKGKKQLYQEFQDHYMGNVDPEGGIR